MELNPYLIHTAIFFVAVVFFYRKFVLAQRERASFQLYKVRDELVYLVASDILSETDPVFVYYYKRVNTVLSMAPNVGIDDMLQALFNNSSSFDKALAKARKDVEKILGTQSAQNHDVRRVIESYYVGIKQMVLSHSSVLRVLFILTRRFNPLSFLERLLPDSVRRAFKAMRYAEKEVCELHGNPCPCL